MEEFYCSLLVHKRQKKGFLLCHVDHQDVTEIYQTKMKLPIPALTTMLLVIKEILYKNLHPMPVISADNTRLKISNLQVEFNHHVPTLVHNVSRIIQFFLEEMKGVGQLLMRKQVSKAKSKLPQFTVGHTIFLHPTTCSNDWMPSKLRKTDGEKVKFSNSIINNVCMEGTEEIENELWDDPKQSTIMSDKVKEIYVLKVQIEDLE